MTKRMNATNKLFVEAIQWITWNDNPAECDIESIARYTSVQLVADLFDHSTDVIATVIRDNREQEYQRRQHA